MCNAALVMTYAQSLDSTAQTPSPKASSALFQLAPSVQFCNTPDISFTAQRCMPEHICRPGGDFGWRDFFWNRELEKSCVELAAVAWYGLRCQFSHAQLLMSGRQVLC